ncbi:MAG: putative Flp pilus assembly protein CpaB [Actinomycetia bacterium]|nr:putative Flp pilus assembly protein CpaB [Actinomycetes bacterium]
MGSRKQLTVVIALVLAAVVIVGTFVYVRGADKRAQDKTKLVGALVAKAAITKGTSGSDATPMIQTKKVPKDALPPNAVAAGTDITKDVAAADIAPGQFIVASSFISKNSPQAAAGPVAASLPSGKQAIAIQLDVTRSVGGFIQSGDHVNVIVVAKPKLSDAQSADPNMPTNVAFMMLQNVKVISVGDTFNATTTATTAATASATTAPGTPAPTATSVVGPITLEVTSDQAQKLALAATTQQIYLSLVPPGYTEAALPPVGDLIHLPAVAGIGALN